MPLLNDDAFRCSCLSTGPLFPLNLTSAGIVSGRRTTQPTAHCSLVNGTEEDSLSCFCLSTLPSTRRVCAVNSYHHQQHQQCVPSLAHFSMQLDTGHCCSLLLLLLITGYSDAGQ